MPERSRYYYFDTVTLSNFALAQNLELLTTRYGHCAFITQEVLNEIIDGIVAGYGALRDIESSVTAGKLSITEPMNSVERESYCELLRVLSPGEASCIVYAKAREGIVVTDDKAARDCCTERNIRVTGTIGILKVCCLDSTLTKEQADTILRRMIEAGFHSPVDRISSIIQDP